MAYTPTEWNTGDIVTAEKLNKLEGGIVSASGSGGSLIVNATLDQATMTVTLDKTTADLINAVNDRLSVILKLDTGAFIGDGGVDLYFGYLARILVYESHACDVYFMKYGANSDGEFAEFWHFEADTENDYLVKHFNS